MKKQTQNAKGKEKESQKDEEGEAKENESEDKPQTEEVEKVKKARKMAPKFVPEMLNDKQKGLASLYKRVDKLDQNVTKGDKESLAILMRIYQQWIFQLFPADFGDMCSKLNQLPAVKKIVKTYVFEKKGFGTGVANRILSNFIDDENDENENNDNENYQPEDQAQEKSHFLDDNNDTDIDIADGLDNNSEQPNSQTIEILDFIGEESQ